MLPSPLPELGAGGLWGGGPGGGIEDQVVYGLQIWCRRLLKLQYPIALGRQNGNIAPYSLKITCLILKMCRPILQFEDQVR